jgi:hypoxanthine phosphoribosyltransferase
VSPQHPAILDDPELGEVVVGAEQIRDRIAELGREITDHYRGEPLLLVGILKGAFVFLSDLARAIDLPLALDFMSVSSYGAATKTSGTVRIVKDLDIDLAGRHVLIVEDIVDSGLTLRYLVKYLAARNPASLDVCSFLLKEGERRSEPDLRFVGFTIPDRFVVGYGLDIDERYRNLPDLRVYTGA